MDELSAEVTTEAPEPVEAQDQPVEEATPTEDVFTDLGTEPGEGEELTPEWLQERHKQMQADYTRKRQADAETAKQRQEELEFLEALRSDPETQRAVLEELSELLSKSDDTAEENLEDNPLESRLAQLEQERATEKAQGLAREIASHIDQLAKESGLELDDEDRNQIFERAIGGEKITKEATASAFQKFQDRQKSQYDKWQKSYLASKTAQTQVPAGTTATDKPDLNTADERIKRMAAMMMGG